MKNNILPLQFLALVLFSFLFSAQALAEEPPAIAIGDEMPASVTGQLMVGVDGKDYTLEKINGEKGSLVIFSCVHCPYVKAWDERMAQLANHYAQEGIGVILINSNDPESYPADGPEGMKEQAKAQGYSFPYVIDATSEVARAFGARKTPDVFLFDAEGKLVYHGAIDDNAQEASAVKSHYLKDALEALVTGSKIPISETKAMGCSIKFRGA